MQLVIEAWTPNAAWLALSREQRAEYISQVDEGMGELQAAGIEVVGWGFSDEAARGIDHVAFSVWRCPTKEAAQQLRQAFADSAWYDFFDQLDFGGAVVDPEVVLQHHIDLR